MVWWGESLEDDQGGVGVKPLAFASILRFKSPQKFFR